MQAFFVVGCSADDVNYERFSPLIEKVCNYYESEAEKGIRASLIFQTLTEKYRDFPHSKAHISGF